MGANINIDNTVKSVSVDKKGDGFRVTVDDREYDVTGIGDTEGTLAFMVGNRTYIAHVSNGDGGVLISIGSRSYHLIEERRDADKPAGGGTGGDGRLVSPMPGNIVAVKATEGETVKAGQPIIVLESMKMQNEISSPIDGVVKKIHCTLGDQVGFGDALAEVVSEDP